MKSVDPHIFHIHYIVHRQHLVAKIIGRDMEEALNAAIHVINFVKSNSVSDGFLCNPVKMKISKLYCLTQ